MGTIDSPLFASVASPTSRRWTINSVPVRFALIAATLGVLCGGTQALIWHSGWFNDSPLPVMLAVCGMIVMVQVVVNYLAARKLANDIRALQESTEAIAAGNFDAPIEVDCACEVGSLAESFRHLVSRLNANLRQMNMAAHSDALTGLPNRAVITHLLESLAALQKPGAVLFIDLKGFRKVNDAFGYRAGDQLLQDVGRRIVKVGFDREILQLDWGVSSFGELERRPPRDITVVRFAADQFVALLPGVVDADYCERHVKAVFQALNLPFEIGGAEINLSAHIGVARMPLDTRDAAELFRFAELAMCAAKADHKPWRFFSAALSDVAVDRSRMESELRQAIERGGIELHYQPQVDSRTLDITGVEALARWRHPARGMISPAVFVPLAEQCGLMPDLGMLVMREAVRQCLAWQQAGVRRRVAINISAAEFDDPSFVERTLATIAEIGADPELLELEITETMAMADLATAHQNLVRLREAGVQIAIDDFGTGFSNLSQLARLPFSTLKIDRSLIEGIGCTEKGEVLVKTIVTMGEGLGYTIVAEGVETPQQRTWLETNGCHVHQGFLFARPMPAAELDDWDQHYRLDVMIGRLQALAVQGARPQRSPSLLLVNSAG